MYFDISNFEVDLKNAIKKATNIIITPHVYPDFDAIGSALGIATLCNHYGGKPYILINDNLDNLDYKVTEIINEAKEDYNFITLEEYNQIKSDNDTLITTDVNKKNIVHVENDLKSFKDIFIIDHHQVDNNTIVTDPEKMYINVFSSSASEIVTNILLDNDIKFDAKIATYLYTGIVLDTNRFMKDTTSQTLTIAAELLKRGASIERANNLLKSNNIQNLKIYKLVNSAKFMNYNLGIAGLAKENRQVYEIKEIAIAADRILNGDMASNQMSKNLSLENLNVSIAMGPIDKNRYRISARSSENGLDVCEIMKKIGGGGNTHSAAAEVNRKNSYKALVKIKDIIKKQ